MTINGSNFNLIVKKSNVGICFFNKMILIMQNYIGNVDLGLMSWWRVCIMA